MRATSWGESGVRRVAVIGGATAAVIVALLVAKPFYSPAIVEAPGAADMNRSGSDQALPTEAVSFVTSPTIEANSEFFFGCGDGSSGYYAERPVPTLAVARYERMP